MAPSAMLPWNPLDALQESSDHRFDPGAFTATT